MQEAIEQAIRERRADRKFMERIRRLIAENRETLALLHDR